MPKGIPGQAEEKRLIVVVSPPNLFEPGMGLIRDGKIVECTNRSLNGFLCSIRNQDQVTTRSLALSQKNSSLLHMQPEQKIEVVYVDLII